MNQQQLEQEISDLKHSVKRALRNSGAIDACPWFGWDNTINEIMTELDRDGFLFFNEDTYV